MLKLELTLVPEPELPLLEDATATDIVICVGGQSGAKPELSLGGVSEIEIYFFHLLKHFKENWRFC